MVLNDKAPKRWSTWANLLGAAVSAALISVPDLGLDGITVAKIMLAGNVIVAVCQAIKQSNI